MPLSAAAAIGVIAAAKQAGLAFPRAIRDAGFEMADSLDTISQTARRVVVLLPGDFDLEAGVRRAIDLLSRNPKGFFLMVESDLHTEEIMLRTPCRQTLNRHGSRRRQTRSN